jgi:hypothetical protein
VKSATPEASPARPSGFADARRRLATPAVGAPLLWLGFLAALTLAFPASASDAVTAVSGDYPWWVWPLGLFVVCFLLGIVAVPAGVGGGVLFVPIVGGFFPFHLDFVRGAGLLVALASALSAGPDLLRNGRPCAAG